MQPPYHHPAQARRLCLQRTTGDLPSGDDCADARRRDAQRHFPADAGVGYQLIRLNPGHSGGALYLAAELARAGRGERTICQLTTASHISRLTGPAAVRVFLRSRASVAALPASHLQACHQQLDALLPGQFGQAGSVLEADLANLNAILHPPGMVCNASSGSPPADRAARAARTTPSGTAS